MCIGMYLCACVCVYYGRKVREPFFLIAMSDRMVDFVCLRVILGL
jgi:hypothetical protein